MLDSRSSRSRRSTRLLAFALGGAMAATLAACGGGDGDEGGGEGEEAAGGSMVFGASQDPVIIDGSLISDGSPHGSSADLRGLGENRARCHRD